MSFACDIKAHMGVSTKLLAIRASLNWITILADEEFVVT
jgi:hypothetical protein